MALQNTLDRPNRTGNGRDTWHKTKRSHRTGLQGGGGHVATRAQRHARARTAHHHLQERQGSSVPSFSCSLVQSPPKRGTPPVRERERERETGPAPSLRGHVTLPPLSCSMRRTVLHHYNDKLSFSLCFSLSQSGRGGSCAPRGPTTRLRASWASSTATTSANAALFRLPRPNPHGFGMRDRATPPVRRHLYIRVSLRRSSGDRANRRHANRRLVDSRRCHRRFDRHPCASCRCRGSPGQESPRRRRRHHLHSQS